MFQKKDYIYSETMGVCLVADVTNLAPKKGNSVSYYVLKSVYQKDKVAYIPVENHSVELRELITPDEAREIATGWQETEDESIRRQLEETADFELQFKMADTLPKEMRTLLYRKGEVDFVLRREELKASKKNEKKKKGNTETVAT